MGNGVHGTAGVDARFIKGPRGHCGESGAARGSAEFRMGRSCFTGTDGDGDPFAREQCRIASKNERTGPAVGGRTRFAAGRSSLEEGNTMKAIRIGDRLVGPDQPSFLIAEIGLNHNGSYELATESIEAAVKAGADAVKFQNYRTEDFLSDRTLTYTYV